MKHFFRKTPKIETLISRKAIEVSEISNYISTSVHYKPTDSHICFFSHPSHAKTSIPFSQFLRLRRLCSDDSEFSNKSDEVRHFFKKRGYHDSLVNTAQQRAQQMDRQSALETSQKEENERIPFTRLRGK